MNSKPLYTRPTLFGVKESEITAMAANRYMGSNFCCTCTGRGKSRT